MVDSSDVHQTLAANRLDPSIQADGHMNAGQGVGGTSDQTIIKEGVEHLKKEDKAPEPLRSTDTTSDTAGLSTGAQGGGAVDTGKASVSNSAVHQEGIDHLRNQTFASQPPASHASVSNAFTAQPPASNPGVDDPTGGISQGNGGLSSTAHIESPVPETQSQGVLGGIASYLGFSKPAPKEAEVLPETGSGVTSDYASTAPTASAPQTSSTNTHHGNSAEAAVAGLGASAAGGAAYLTGSHSSQNSANDLQQRESVANTSTGTGLNDSLTSSAAHTAPTTSMMSGTTDAPSQSNMSETRDPSQSNTADTTSGPSQSELRAQDRTADDKTTEETKGTKPSERKLEDAETTTGGDKQTEDTTDKGQAGAGPGDKGEENKPPAAAGGHSGAVENPSAIPTAGGERLGEKHWGESKIVPDVPKKTDEAGVSSKDGQPTDQVKDNTAANTGGATGGPSSSSADAHDSSQHEKEGLVDKIKDKLHIGKKH